MAVVGVGGSGGGGGGGSGSSAGATPWACASNGCINRIITVVSVITSIRFIMVCHRHVLSITAIVTNERMCVITVIGICP